jgi:hypothetical protein
VWDKDVHRQVPHLAMIRESVATALADAPLALATASLSPADVSFSA